MVGRTDNDGNVVFAHGRDVQRKLKVSRTVDLVGNVLAVDDDLAAVDHVHAKTCLRRNDCGVLPGRLGNADRCLGNIDFHAEDGNAGLLAGRGNIDR